MEARAVALGCVALLLVLVSPLAFGDPTPPSSSHLTPAPARLWVVAQDGSGDFRLIQEAVEASQAGDRVEVRPGVYHESVRIETPGLTLEGTSREGVILDGRLREGFVDGIHVHRAPGVTVRNLTVQRFLANGIYFMESDDFRAVHVTALDNRLYGLYATHSRHGEFVDSEAVGSGDSGFYFGEVSRCNCTLRNVVAHDNVIGYSGTRSTHITIRDSWFHNNSVGVLPNALVPDLGHMLTEHFSLEALWPSDNVIQGNRIENNNNRDVRAHGWTARYGVPIGTGVALAGGMFNAVTDNVIRGHERWGVAEFFFLVPPFGNRFASNVLEGNRVDFWRDGYGLGSCQTANTESYPGSSAVLASCDLPSFLRLSLPDPSRHIELMVESERPTGTFEGAPAYPGHWADGALAIMGPSLTYGMAIVAVGGVLGMLFARTGGGSRDVRSPRRRSARGRPVPFEGTEKAAVGRRIAAFLLDALIVALLYGVLMSGLILTFLPVANLFELLEAALTVTLIFSPLAFLISLAIWVVYGGVLEGFAGQTLGKRALGLVVTRKDGSDITLGPSLVRNALRYVDGAGLYLVGLLVMLATKRRQRLGDKLAGTVVVRSRPSVS